MGMLDHWHPVHPSPSLKKKPIEIQIAGRTICLYRTSTGEAAAVDNVCPHRRAKLSVGKVVGDRIRCHYHGWTFDPCGHGESPGTPKMTACTDSFETCERHGYVWLKARESTRAFPTFDTDGYYSFGTFYHVMPAPLELTVDNFAEIEHTGTVHDIFGYDLDRMHEVKLAFDVTDDSYRVRTAGPAKRLSPIVGLYFGVRDGYLFCDDYTTRFSPVHLEINHFWTTADGSREAMIRWRVYLYLWPIDPVTTAAVSFAYAKSRYPGPAGGLRLVRWILRRELDRTLKQDVEMLGNLADRSVNMEGMKLSRFDKVVGLTRERIASIYRGESKRRIELPVGSRPIDLDAKSA